MRTLRTILCASLLAAFVAPPVSANHSWGGYHWGRTSNPFTLKVGNNLSGAWTGYFTGSTTYFAQMAGDWSLSSVLDLAGVAGSVANVRKCSPTLGRVEVCNTTYGRNGWLGIAQIWASGTHITQGTVKLNDTYFGTAQYNTPGWRQLVICQEVGHTLGLDHQDEAFGNPNLGTCMDYTSNPSGPPSNEHPNQHDYDELVTIYSHTDASGTILSTPPATAAGESPQEWGQLMRSSQRGRTEVYERELGGGQRIITFVIWAEERGQRH